MESSSSTTTTSSDNRRKKKRVARPGQRKRVIFLFAAAGRDSSVARERRLVGRSDVGRCSRVLPERREFQKKEKEKN